jgi:hypothetical protein
LAQGEPGFAYDTNELKIGDGVRSWKELPLLSCNSTAISGNLTVVEALPPVGNNDLIYKVSATQKLYIWNNITENYQEIGEKQEVIDNIIIVETLPDAGQDNLIYKVEATQ